jgi:membrane protease YdiL (CAAX protease family)
MCVALLEEVLFRGALFGTLRKAVAWPIALLISSVVYAWLHFFQRPAAPPHITWASGWVLLPQMMHGFVEWETLVPGFFTLTIAGLLLGLAFQRTRSLYFSIGLHAGWIFWLKLYGFATSPVPGADLRFWGSQKLVDGWLGLVVMALTGLVYLSRMRAQCQTAPRIEPSNIDSDGKHSARPNPRLSG